MHTVSPSVPNYCYHDIFAVERWEIYGAAARSVSIFAAEFGFPAVMGNALFDSDTLVPAILFAGLLVLAIWIVWSLLREVIPPFRHSRAPTKYLRTRQQARRGSAKACVTAADMLMTGSDGARYNPSLGLHYLQMALELYARQARDGGGYPLLKMAEIYERFGKHARPHITNMRADQMYRHALKVNVAQAEAGDVNGMAFAGYQYFHGLGCIADPEIAAHYLEGAAKLGHAPSMKTLAEYYMLGVKKKPDPVKAAELYHQAALAGDPEAVERVGDHYFTSLGQLASRELAYFWYAHAARLGRKDAANKLQHIEAEWTPKQILAVQERLRTWAPA